MPARLGRRIKLGQHGVDFVLTIGGGGRSDGAGFDGEWCRCNGGLRWRRGRTVTVAPGAAAAVVAAEACSGALAGLLTSSSAMIRRMEARISSIEGSCAFAAWVIP